VSGGDESHSSCDNKTFHFALFTLAGITLEKKNHEFRIIIAAATTGNY
jgi:hypothetical protein